MMGRTHGLVGLTIGATAASVAHAPALVAACAAAGFVGGLLPDLDEPGSMISNLPWIFVLRPLMSMASDELGLALLLLPLWVPVALASLLLLIFLQAASYVTRTLSGGHREATHTLWAWLLVSVVAMGSCFVGHAPWLVCWAASAGYASHLLADGCTPLGLPWRGMRMHVVPAGMWIRTGGNAESLLAVLYGAVVALAWLTVLRPQSEQTVAALTVQGHAIAIQAQGSIAHLVTTWWPHLGAHAHP